MRTSIAVFGLGYVGTVSAACLAERGHTVVGVDQSATKVQFVQSGRSPIIEPHVNDLVARNVRAGRLSATMDAEHAVKQSDLSLVCVGTPSQANGSLSLSAVEAVAGQIGNGLRDKNHPHTVVVRSTVLPGTTRSIVARQLSEASGRCAGREVGLAFNPEFLREGSAVADFNQPSKTVVGAFDEETGARVLSLYEGLSGPKITTDLETAEFVKYVDNAWHGLKVTFGNEIGLLAKTLGIDSHSVMDIFCQDTRLNISGAYLRPGFAFGGSCLPKDLRALTYFARKLDLNLPVLNHIAESNRSLIELGTQWILSQERKKVLFLGISFKAGTDDVRESPFVEVAERLIGKGRDVRIFDPNVRLGQVTGTNREFLLTRLPHIAQLLVSDISNAVDWADVIVVTTNDPAYRTVLHDARNDQVVLHFARPDRNVEIRREGFLW
ncbi:MAG TPA: nucleotide sugar dehydrogenase [Xanthobacteraceae bacterium]|jgi:GDP-mannose 6-dehydrogenase